MIVKCRGRACNVKHVERRDLYISIVLSPCCGDCEFVTSLDDIESLSGVPMVYNLMTEQLQEDLFFERPRVRLALPGEW